MILESYELGIRIAMHGIGSTILEKLINADGGDYRGRIISCEEGHAAVQALLDVSEWQN